ncbi:MAG: phosphoribosylformylglycinamidine cyclo-ligase [Dehalococcoidia bacterium]|nr:phosphoribosylformylglycinamidine cyclo-ligase [Dehalococcoidia bacterium]
MGSEERGTQAGSRYAEAGVDIDAATRARNLIKAKARTTFRPEVLTEIGAFAGLFKVPSCTDPVLVSSVDGVGTKLKIAIAMDRHDTVGVDLVNHCVNDIFTCGADPLFFLDYIAAGKLVPEKVESVVAGLAAACRDVGCALIGGETAEMPGMYSENDYDLAGFIVGIVERKRILDTDSIEEGDPVLGLPSSGLHTNGYSLVRRIFDLERKGRRALEKSYPELGRTLGEELLEPHRCYYTRLRPIIHEQPGAIKGLAHITGGGILENVGRILPDGLGASFRSGSWPVPPVFELIRDRGKVSPGEMYRVFNMGIGMVLVCSPAQLESMKAALPEAILVGEVTRIRGGKPVVIS